ncbi:glycerate kinase [Celerinatantimonas sp. YJH-8]|uniref:glycerate kinase n=1 Tax=Celerinatantimonas sp. YJH-8 TaxID=3228714 RepID=UPI0038CAFDDF
MKIVVAPDSFKESLSAMHAARAIIDGFSVIFPDADYSAVPLADGGEGTVVALVSSAHGTVARCQVHGSRMTLVDSFLGFIDDGQTAVIEVAAACGLEQLAPTLRNPKLTTSYGVGELILQALDHEVSRILIGLGGSASNDGGVGMLQALGARFLDANHQPIAAGGAALIDIVDIDLSSLDPRLSQVMLEVACDVDNLLCGPQGASAVFGPQKGADHQMIVELDQALLHYAKCMQQQHGIELLSIPGGGAAGGLGAALSGVLNARMKTGIDLVMDAMDFDSRIQGAQLIITGEGRLDGQSVAGKTPIGVARRARQQGIAVIAIGGSLGKDYEKLYEQGISAVFSCINRVDSLANVLQSAEADLKICAENLARLWKTAQS